MILPLFVIYYRWILKCVDRCFLGCHGSLRSLRKWVNTRLCFSFFIPVISTIFEKNRSCMQLDSLIDSSLSYPYITVIHSIFLIDQIVKIIVNNITTETLYIKRSCWDGQWGWQRVDWHHRENGGAALEMPRSILLGELILCICNNLWEDYNTHMWTMCTRLSILVPLLHT